MADSVMEGSSTTGQNDYVLTGAVGSNRPFDEDYEDGETFDFWAQTPDKTRWEHVIGTLDYGPPRTLTRATVIKSSAAGAKIDWQAGEVYYVFAIASSDILDGFTKASRDATRPWWVRFGNWLKSSTPAAGYDQITVQDGTGDSGDIGIGVVNPASHKVTIYGTPPGFIKGMTWTNTPGPGDTTNDLDFAGGSCMSDDGIERIDMTAQTIQTDVAFGAGTNGVLDTGAVGNNAYDVYAIKNPTTGETKYLTCIAGNAPMLPSGYTRKRRVNWFKRLAGAIVLAKQYELAGGAIEHDWTSKPNDVQYIGTLTTVRVTQTLAFTPTHLAVEARLLVTITHTTANGKVYISNPDNADEFPNAQVTNSVANQDQSGEVHVRTKPTTGIALKSNTTLAGVVGHTMSFKWSRL